MIGRVLDIPETKKQGKPIIRDSVDDYLDEYRLTLRGLPDFLTKIAIAETTKYKLDNVMMQIIYRPQVGYLLRIKSAPLNFVPPEDFERYFVLQGEPISKTAQ